MVWMVGVIFVVYEVVESLCLGRKIFFLCCKRGGVLSDGMLKMRKYIEYKGIVGYFWKVMKVGKIEWKELVIIFNCVFLN